MEQPSRDAVYPRLHLEEHVYALNRFSLSDQARKDTIHGRLMDRCEIDEATGCWIFTGGWTERGFGRMRVGAKVYTLRRVAAWIYLGLELWDRRVVYQTCESAACFNWEHLSIADSQSIALAEQRKLEVYRPNSGRRFSYAKAEEIRQRFAGGETVRGLANAFGVRTIAITKILDGRVWPYERQRRRCCA